MRFFVAIDEGYVNGVPGWAIPPPTANDWQIPKEVGGSREGAHACTKDDRVLCASDLFAQRVLSLEDPSQLCPFLRTLDEEEFANQGEERRTVRKRGQLCNGILSLVHGVFCVTLGISFAGGASRPFLLPTVAWPVGIVAGVVGGIAITVIGIKTSMFLETETPTEKELGTSAQIIARLEGKVQRIAEERAKEGKSPEERDQLTKVEEAFRTTLEVCRREDA